MKTPEIMDSGKTMPNTTGWAASGFLIIEGHGEHQSSIAAERPTRPDPRDETRRSTPRGTGPRDDGSRAPGGCTGPRQGSRGVPRRFPRLPLHAVQDRR